MYRWTAVVTLLAVALYFAMMWRVGTMRGRSGLKAPATTGHPDFERAYRVQMNTLEGMPLFLLPLWLSTIYVSDRYAALVGLVWLVGRLVYMLAYTRDPAKRGTGFAIQGLATVTLFVMATSGVVRAFL